MKKIRGSKELYGELLKTFYLGDYQKNDRFLTQKETREVYGVSRSTVEKVFRMLQQDGFLASRCHYGSTVTFDRNDPTHVAKVPLYHHDPAVREAAAFEFPLIMLTRIIYSGLCRANAEQLERHRQDAEEILRRLAADEPCFDLVKAWHFHIVADMDNVYLTEILDHFFSRYLYFNSRWNLSPESWRQLTAYVRQFYTAFLQLLADRDFEGFIPLKRAYYEAVYQIPDALLFSAVKEEVLFPEEAQYRKLLYTILFAVYRKGMKQGDALPTIAWMSQRYQVSAKTVRNAYAAMAEVGLLSGRQGAGTRLLADPNDAGVKQRILNRLECQKNRLEQRIAALSMFDECLLQHTSQDRLTDLLDRMRAELREQRRAAWTGQAPFLVSDVAVSPVVRSLPVNSLQKYYWYLQKPIAEFVEFHRLDDGVVWQSNQAVYDLLCGALDELSQGDGAGFAAQVQQAQRLNGAQLLRCYGDFLSRWREGEMRFPAPRESGNETEMGG